METINTKPRPQADSIVLTVPMRNGNSPFEYSECMSVKSSYRTYEEWKLDEANFVFASRFWVLTVPMRNGNAT